MPLQRGAKAHRDSGQQRTGGGDRRGEARAWTRSAWRCAWHSGWRIVATGWLRCWLPQAHAQPQLLLVPVAIVWGLMATARGSATMEVERAMQELEQDVVGQSGGSGFPSTVVPSVAAASWLTKIGVMLSGQSQPSNQSTAPIYDNAGLLVSQAASCVLPPGNCKPDDYDRLQEEVKQACGDRHARASEALFGRADLGDAHFKHGAAQKLRHGKGRS